ncbi:hypothetical protein ACJX0J_026974, partial [Zea mays]
MLANCALYVMGSFVGHNLLVEIHLISQVFLENTSANSCGGTPGAWKHINFTIMMNTIIDEVITYVNVSILFGYDLEWLPWRAITGKYQRVYQDKTCDWDWLRLQHRIAVGIMQRIGVVFYNACLDYIESWTEEDIKNPQFSVGHVFASQTLKSVFYAKFYTT